MQIYKNKTKKKTKKSKKPTGLFFFFKPGFFQPCVQELEGTAGAVAFDAAPQLNLEDMMGAGGGGVGRHCDR